MRRRAVATLAVAVDTTRRLWAFLMGDMESAEQLALPDESPVPWLSESARGEVVSYALDAAIRSAATAESALSGVASKASSLLTLSIGLSVAALGGTGVALRTAHSIDGIRWLSFALFCLVDVALILASLYCFFASGLGYGGLLNIARLSTGNTVDVKSLKLREIDAWHRAAMIAMSNLHTTVGQLYVGRRFVMWALVIALPAIILTPVP